METIARTVCVPKGEPRSPENKKRWSVDMTTEKGQTVSVGSSALLGVLSELEAMCKELLAKCESANSTVDDEIHLSWPVLSPYQIAGYRARLATLCVPSYEAAGMDALALELTRSFWGYFEGDSSGSASALKYFDATGRHLPGPQSLIARTKDILARHLSPNHQDDRRRSP